MKKFIFLLPLAIGLHINMQPVLANQITITSKMWEEEYLSDPRWAKYYSENPEAAAHSKANWEEVQAIKVRGPKDGEECARVAGNWNFDENRCIYKKTATSQERQRAARSGSWKPADTRKYASNANQGCPPGTRHYRTNGLFGLGARDIGCMTAYEAESLRRQNVQNLQNNLNRNRMRNCTTNFIGSTAYTNCY